jgi:hypothetical protein
VPPVRHDSAGSPGPRNRVARRRARVVDTDRPRVPPSRLARKRPVGSRGNDGVDDEVHGNLVTYQLPIA